MTRRERGFTLIEMMIVVVILSILAGILLPKVRDFRSRAISAKAIGAMSVTRTAAYQYNEASNGWPASGTRGVIPAGLAPYLPAGFSFRESEFELMWRRQNVTINGVRSTQQMVMIYPSTATLCARIANQLGGSRNPDLVIACTGGTTTVTLYVDR